MAQISRYDESLVVPRYQTGRGLDVHPNSIRKWKKRLAEHGERAFRVKGTWNEELTQVKREDGPPSGGGGRPKKAVGIFSKGPRRDASPSKTIGSNAPLRPGAVYWKSLRAAPRPGAGQGTGEPAQP